MAENRRHKRMPKKIKSEVHIEDVMTFSSSQNLSHGGIFISTPEPVKAGTVIDLMLYIPDSEPIKIKGIVRWTRDEDKPEEKSGMGIEFINASESELKDIKKIID